jgi:hypothetical protein
VAGGRPRTISSDDGAFIVETAKTRPEKLGRPFTRWSIRKLAGYLADNPTRRVKIGWERLRQLLARMRSRFSGPRRGRSRTTPSVTPSWIASKKVLTERPDRCFAFDEFLPLAVHPVSGVLLGGEEEAAAVAGELPQDVRGPAVPCLLLGGDNELWGVVRKAKSFANSFAAIRAAGLPARMAR